MVYAYELTVKIPVWSLGVLPLLMFALGFSMNALAMRANGNQMPVFLHKCDASTMESDEQVGGAPLHTCLIPNTRLKIFVDWIFIRGLGVASLGDLLEFGGEMAFWPCLWGLVFLKLDEKGVFRH